jgi:N-acetyl-gamma-glutamyl-phosphate reductase
LVVSSVPDNPTVLIAGASGFAGAIAARLIDRHPNFTLGPITARADAGRPLSAIYPHHRVDQVLEVLDLGGRHGGVDAAIVGYPHAASAPVVAELRDRGIKVVDLSADFRFKDVSEYERYYGTHPHTELLAEAVYGLPELNRTSISGADLVAGPGCYPTAAILALAPLARAGLIADAVIDAKSGVSGAGRVANETTHFVSVAENVRAYKVGAHRHAPEIDEQLSALAGSPLRVTFTPHLVPLDQGELVSCYVTPATPIDPADTLALFADAYRDEPFVDVVAEPPGVRDVRETNGCRIHCATDQRTGKLIVFAAIDNLWKGTASQAVQSLNLMFDIDETAGLL